MITQRAVLEEIDDVERCRLVRRQIESEHPGFEAYFAWAKGIDVEYRRAQRVKRKSKANDNSAVKRRGKPRPAAKSAKTRGA